jgi:hypothetical protein
VRTLVVLTLLALGSVAHASKPVKKTLTGCVVDGKFYSIDGVAYPIATPAKLDLTPFEGKSLALTGLLYPGDRFEPESGSVPDVKGACPAASVRMIQRDKVLRFRVEATKAAKAGDFDAAVAAIGQAMALVAPPDCDTVTDRAHVFALKGDTAAAAKDVAAIRGRRCVVDKGKRMNPLLLTELGIALTDKGDKKTALDALQLALAACDGDWCKGDINKAIAAAKK